MSAASKIPIIDLGRTGRPGDLPAVNLVRDFGAACADPGFMVITGHGVGADVISRLLTEVRGFFAMPADVKKRYRVAPGIRDLHPHNRFRGYSGSYRRLDGPPDHIELFHATWFENRAEMLQAGYAPEFTENYADNIWPAEPSGFRDAWRHYFTDVRMLGNHLLHLAALALDLPQDWFDAKFSRQSSYMVANYYAAQDGPPTDGGQRLHPHTDYGGFTILFQDSAVGGLEVELRGGEWTRVPYIPGAFIVNLGDLLAKWTNDAWVATPHRVRTPEAGEYGHDRVSVPFFQQPNFDALIEAIPTCAKPGDSLHHAPVLWRDWNSTRINELRHNS